jgi:hypothetical protein
MSNKKDKPKVTAPEPVRAQTQEDANKPERRNG